MTSATTRGKSARTGTGSPAGPLRREVLPSRVRPGTYSSGLAWAAVAAVLVLLVMIGPAVRMSISLTVR
jgi:hypothetical protein